MVPREATRACLMPSDGESPTPDRLPPCSEAGCDITAAFWLYDPRAGSWRPICDRHARHAHPSIEVRVWLESGYMTPAELGEPDGPPAEPSGGRQTAFRSIIDETIGWSQ